MKRILFFALLVSALASPAFAQAVTFEWNRNAETDMKDYKMYACFTLGCTVVKDPVNLIGTILQTAAGVKPTLAYTIGPRAGAAAVTARDTSNNESGLSAPVSFNQLPVPDATAPSPPTGLIIR